MKKKIVQQFQILHLSQLKYECSVLCLIIGRNYTQNEIMQWKPEWPKLTFKFENTGLGFKQESNFTIHVPLVYKNKKPSDWLQHKQLQKVCK